jgi:ABC-2 type transport system permease protein
MAPVSDVSIMNTLLSMVVKDLRLLMRDRMGFFFALFFPLITAIFFGTVFSAGGDSSSDDEGKKLKVLVVDSDATPASRKFVGQLEGASEFKVTTAPTLDGATELIRQGKGYVAAVHIPPGYGEASERMFWGEPPVLEVYTDPSRTAEIGMFQGLLTKYAFMRMQEMFTNPSKFIPSTKDALARLNDNANMDPKAKSALQQFLPNLQTFLGNMPELEAAAATDGTEGNSAGGLGSWEPVKITSKAVQAAGQKGPPSGFAVTFPQGIMWGVLGCSLAMAVSLVTERTRGTLVRLRMAPVSRWGVLGGKGLTCFVLIMVMGTLLIGVGMLPMFKVHPVSPLMLALGLASTAACFTGLMMLVASLGKTEAAAGGLGWSIMLVMSMIGGGMVPLFVMPGWLQKLSDVSPVKWGILAIEGGVWRGFTMAEMMTPCAVLLGIGGVAFAIGVGVLKKNA